MTIAINVAIGLVTALVGWAANIVWRRSRDWFHHRRFRHFLGPALDGGLQIIVSRFWLSAFHEPTGLVGGGDALALREIAGSFDAVRFKNYSAVYVDESEVDRQGNLIILGSSDTNEITRDAMRLLKPGLLVCDPGPGINMEVHDQRRGKPAGSPPGGHATARRQKYKATDDLEFGVIIRTPNPFQPNKALILISGTYGYGSWAGARLIQDKSFLQRCEQVEAEHQTGPGDNQWIPLECLFSVRIFDKRPMTPEVLILRPIE